MTNPIDQQKERRSEQSSVDPNNDRGYPKWVPVLAVGAFVVSLGFGVAVGLGGIAFVMQDKLEQMGQLGDFVGGITNPLLAFLTFTALIYTINLQRRQLDLAAKQLDVMGQELALTREEATLSRKALEASREEFERSASAQESSMIAQKETARLMSQQVRIQNLVERYKAVELLSQAALRNANSTMDPNSYQEVESLRNKAQNLLWEIDQAASN